MKVIVWLPVKLQYGDRSCDDYFCKDIELPFLPQIGMGLALARLRPDRPDPSSLRVEHVDWQPDRPPDFPADWSGVWVSMANEDMTRYDRQAVVELLESQGWTDRPVWSY